MKKYLLLLVLAISVGTGAMAQKTVSAVVKFTGTDTTLTIGKNENFLVELWVPNRKNYQWSVAQQAANCKFIRSQIGEAATMPGAPEQQLWFFKSTQKGIDSLRFIYKSPYPGEPTVEKKLKVIVE